MPFFKGQPNERPAKLNIKKTEYLIELAVFVSISGFWGFSLYSFRQIGCDLNLFACRSYGHYKALKGLIRA